MNQAEQMLADAVAAGCPRDQVERFLLARFYPQPKQWQFCAAARRCDKEDGPVSILTGGARGGGKQILTTEKMLAWRREGDKLTPMIKQAMALRVGDFLIGSAGKPVKITAVSVPEVRQFYRLTFDDGAFLEASDNHQWTVFDLSKRAKGDVRRGRCAVVMTTEDLMGAGLRWRSGNRFALPLLSGPVEVSEPVEPALSPWLLGYWLGNGNSQGSCVTCHSDDGQEIAGYCREVVGDGNCEVRVYQEGTKRATILLKGWIEKLAKAGWPCQMIRTASRTHRKFDKSAFPFPWQLWSARHRQELLMGLMDSDGTIKDGCNAEFDNARACLVSLVKQLMQSLGQKTSKIQSRPPRKAHWSMIYRVTSGPTMQVFRLKRKASNLKTSGREMKSSRRYLVSIEPTRLEEGICFTVDAPDHLYVAGPEYVLTHNSSIVLAQSVIDDCQRFPGLKCLWLRKVGKTNVEHLADMRQSVLAGVKHEYRQDGVLKLPNNSRVIAGHFKNENDIDAYLGVEYDLIITEEATTLTARKRQSIRTCLRSSKPGWRPREYLTTNPGGVNHVGIKKEFIDPWRAGREKETRFVPSRCTDNVHNNPEYLKILESLPPGWQRRAWLDGDWDIAAGQFFVNWREDKHVIDSWHDSKAMGWFCALDGGFRHWTVCLLFAHTGDGQIVIVDEHAEREMTPERHADCIKKMLARHGIIDLGTLDYFVAGADLFATESDGASVAAEYARNDIHLEPAEMDRVNGWAAVTHRLGDPERDKFPPKLVVHRRCKGLIERIPAMCHSETRPEDVEKVDCDPDTGEGGDDHCDAMRYGVVNYKAQSILTNAMPLGEPAYGRTHLA